ncbi:hypothetical protein BN946_scf184970.g89 [Trametes cinnabarina]|uniref:C2H2-type domain-containing protein n=1 Tax=Pycnoporus cinnabarinus TaxID=5643 RepID=A0A060SCM4_PYCCI|nr:hypothetical protein BN946_scf184970.g89 [Trametes cinnabarina]
MRPVRLTGPRRLLSFHRFSLSIGSHRLSLVRALVVELLVGPLEEGDKQAFFHIVTSCTQLRSFDLLYCDDILREETRLVEALSLLKSLIRFTAQLSTEDDALLYEIIHRAVNSMQCALRELSLPLIPAARTETDIRSLSQVHPRIEQLGLHIHSLASPPPAAADLYHTFPNLQELELLSFVYLDVGDFPPGSLVPNQNASTTHNRRETWTSLQLLRASIAVIYSMGLTCPVRDLDLDYYEVATHAHVAQIVSHLRPKKLSITLYCAPTWALPPLDEPYILVDHSEGAAVKWLDLRITFTSAYVPDNEDVMRNVRPFVSPSSVEVLQLTISPYNFSDDPEDVVNPEFPVEPEVAKVAEIIDVGPLVQELAGACPSVRIVAIAVIKGGHTVWRVTRGEDVFTAARLHPFEGRQVTAGEASTARMRFDPEADGASTMSPDSLYHLPSAIIVARSVVILTGSIYQDHEGANRPVPQKVKCKICFETLSRSTLSLHIKGQHARNKEDLMYRCSVRGCGFRHPMRTRVGEHYLVAHANIPAAFACNFKVIRKNGREPLCSYKSPTGSDLRRHLKKVHGCSLSESAKHRLLPAIPPEDMYDEFVLPPLTRRIELDDDLENVDPKVTKASAPLPADVDKVRERRPALDHRNVNTLSKTRANDAQGGPSTDTMEKAAVAKPVLGKSIRPTLVPLKELERIHLERFGYRAGDPEQSCVPVADQRLTLTHSIAGRIDST